ncbi:MAG: RNA methyltransferase, partial [Gammaproteobacteria bacterium]
LTECQVCADLAEAVADTSLVAATTARVRSVRWPEHPPDAAARILLEKAQQQQDVAIVFGQESSGLSNAQLDLCNFMIRIPTHPDFSSLNLAAAVQIVCYELQRHLQALQPADEPLPEQAVSVQNMERFYQRLEQALIRLGYLDQNNPGKLMRRLRRLFNRAGLDNDEYQVLMGVLTAMEKRFGTDL